MTIIHDNFLTRRMVGGGDPFYLKFWVKFWVCWSEKAAFQSIFARNASTVTAAKKFNYH